MASFIRILVALLAPAAVINHVGTLPRSNVAPFTYLAICATAGTLLYENVLGSLNVNLGEAAAQLQRNYGELGLKKFFEVSFPAIASVVLVGVVFALVLGRKAKSQRSCLLHTFCYAMGFEFLILTVAASLFVVAAQVGWVIIPYVAIALYAYVLRRGDSPHPSSDPLPYAMVLPCWHARCGSHAIC